MSDEAGSLVPPVREDRVIPGLPKWFTHEASLQLKEDFHPKVTHACEEHTPGTVKLKPSKVVLIGDVGVPKAGLICRFCNPKFDKTTVGVDFQIEHFKIAGIPYRLQIWDTAGDQKCKTVTSSYCRGAHVIILVFDIADPPTLEHTRQWLDNALKSKGLYPGTPLVFLVGIKDKIGSEDEGRQAELDAIRMAKEMQAEYWSVSTKTELREKSKECRNNNPARSMHPE
ncbi:ras-related protein Rab-36-like isoform X2 [Ambystoma mexicanum]|uniref:ras-related protein Rab-36-like isoform X2 n=1 Tax=Ambystoma mexicanum TaxID=8296 RepID=UPI0037E79FC8